METERKTNIEGLNDALAPDAFGVVIKKAEIVRSKPEEDWHDFIIKYGVVFNAESQRTEVTISEKIDLQKLVESYKDECGLEAALRLVKLGQRDINELADDGKHGYDITGVPDFAGDALRGLQPGIEAGEKLAEDLGLPSGIKATEEEIKTYVQKALDEIKAKEAAASSDKKGDAE